MPDGVFKYKKAGKPAWGVRLKFQDDEGRWRAKTWRGFVSQADAIEYRDRQRADRYREKYFPGRPAAHTVREYFDHWLNAYAAHHCKFSTFHDYGLILNKHLLPVVGHLQLAELTAAHLKPIALSLNGRSRQTLRNVFTPIREGLSHAVAEGLIASNPTAPLATLLKQPRAQARPATPLKPLQVQQLLKATKKQDPALHLAVLLAVRAGLRMGEVLGLREQDLDRRHRTALIQRTIVRRQATTPKNHRRRTVDLTDSVMRAIGQPATVTRDLPLVHRHSRGVSPEWLTRAFHQALTAAKLPRIRFHDLRHSFASHLIHVNATPKYIQTQMGHGSISVTFDVYGHLFPGERFVDQLEPGALGKRRAIR